MSAQRRSGPQRHCGRPLGRYDALRYTHGHTRRPSSVEQRYSSRLQSGSAAHTVMHTQYGQLATVWPWPSLESHRALEGLALEIREK